MIAAPPIRLDIACGQNKREGFVGIDLAGDADIVHDLFSFPWPLEDALVGEVFIRHFVEHIPHYRPEWGGLDGWIVFWDEVYRILIPGGTVTVLHPYLLSHGAFRDPTHTRYIHETTWYYLDREWLREASLEHYFGRADFEVVNVTGLGGARDMPEIGTPEQAFGRAHYWNVMDDLQVELRKR